MCMRLNISISPTLFLDTPSNGMLRLDYLAKRADLVHGILKLVQVHLSDVAVRGGIVCSSVRLPQS